ncbi:MAG: uracil-DNA glycosylase family protein, partial [Muriicola sp.]|nr:uracil-DNA glycosylase family protein [Muriicola sp.]
MFLHTHPYEPFLFSEATKLIVGTLPPPRFTMGNLKQGDVNFCYGSIDGQLWPILDRLFGLNLTYENTAEAIAQRKNFLKDRNIGICDIVASAQRSKIDASDIGMQDISLRNLLGYLEDYPNIETILFTGGNSKNGPEYFFRKHLKSEGLHLSVVSSDVPRIHEFTLKYSERRITTISLTAPSGAANRAVGSIPEYKARKAKNPGYTVMDYRAEQYKRF